MSVAEIPAKVIEQTGSINEVHLRIAFDLTKLFYQSPKVHATEESILKTFLRYHKQIEKISPPPIDKVTPRNKLKLLAGSLLSATVVLVLYYLFCIRWGL